MEDEPQATVIRTWLGHRVHPPCGPGKEVSEWSVPGPGGWGGGGELRLSRAQGHSRYNHSRSSTSFHHGRSRTQRNVLPPHPCVCLLNAKRQFLMRGTGSNIKYPKTQGTVTQVSEKKTHKYICGKETALLELQRAFTSRLIYIRSIFVLISLDISTSYTSSISKLS